MKITQVRALEMLVYEPLTGVLRWRVDHGKKLAGSIAGTSDKKGHWVVGLDYGQHQAARLIWLMVKGEWPENEVDHKDGDGENNRWLNLRPATHKQNLENLPRQGYGEAGFRGVHWDKQRGKWECRIEHFTKVKHLGRHDTIIDAVAARLSAERTLYTHHREGAP